MTDDIKIALKMTNFSIQSKWMKALLIIFFVMGILFEFMPGAYSPNNLGGLYLMLTPARLTLQSLFTFIILTLSQGIRNAFSA